MSHHAKGRFEDDTADQIAKTMRLATRMLNVPHDRDDDLDQLCKEVLPDTVSKMIADAYGRAWAPKGA